MRGIQINEPTKLQMLMNLCSDGITVADIDDCDCGPRFETILNQSIYLGIWCYSDTEKTVFSLEVRAVAETSSTWLEDGVKLAPDSEIRIYPTFNEAFENLGKIVLLAADRSPV